MNLIVANWKMNGSAAEVTSFADKLDGFLNEVSTSSEIVFCPPFLWLEGLSGIFSKGAQNCSEKPEGAMTGEIAASMLVKAGCEYVIVGHSERREAGESDEIVTQKLASAKAAGLKTILCIGERDGEDFETVISSQVQQADVIAYEPVWAIGTGRTPTLDEINERHAFIKSKSGGNVLYGGSVKPENAKDILNLENVAGVLVGGASLDFESFKTIILGSI